GDEGSVHAVAGGGGERRGDRSRGARTLRGAWRQAGRVRAVAFDDRTNRRRGAGGRGRTDRLRDVRWGRASGSALEPRSAPAGRGAPGRVRGERPGLRRGGAGGAGRGR